MALLRLNRGQTLIQRFRLFTRFLQTIMPSNNGGFGLMYVLKPATRIDTLFVLEDELLRTATGFNLHMRSAPLAIRGHLQGLSQESLDKVSSNMEAVVQSLRVCAQEGLNPWDDREFFKISMNALRLSYPNDFLDNVVFGDLIEGYDMNRLQVFRNMRFMEMSTYSLMEILAFEWPLLFDRSQMITDQMISYCDEILWASNKTINFQIPTHFIRELRSKERQLLEVNFKYLSPLFSGPNQPYGILGTCAVKSISSEAQADNLSFV
jgi:hypothetical protein